jgi:hypothetical protein
MCDVRFSWLWVRRILFTWLWPRTIWQDFNGVSKGGFVPIFRLDRTHQHIHFHQVQFMQFKRLYMVESFKVSSENSSMLWIEIRLAQNISHTPAQVNGYVARNWTIHSTKQTAMRPLTFHSLSRTPSKSHRKETRLIFFLEFETDSL